MPKTEQTMKQVLMAIILLVFPVVQRVQAQSTKEIRTTLKTVSSIQQVDKLRTVHKDWNIEIIQYDDSDTSLLKMLVDLTVDETTEINQANDTYVLKVLKESEIKEYRVSYIFLNGEDMTVNQIDSLQRRIIKEYEGGVSFGTLAKNYSMDGNAERGGDLGWFSPEKMVKEFSEPVKSHTHKEIFTVNIPLRSWYYVVLKTYPDRERVRTGMVKIKSSS